MPFVLFKKRCSPSVATLPFLIPGSVLSDWHGAILDLSGSS
jgi:hypothetical protein